MDQQSQINKRPVIIKQGEILLNKYIITEVYPATSSVTYFYKAISIDETEIFIKQLIFFAPENIKMFRNESEILKSNQYKGLPRWIDFFEIEEGFFLLMEYIDGQDLKTYASSKFLKEDEIYNIFMKILDILEYLYMRNPPIIHNDISPINIRIKPNGDVVILDLGSSKLLTSTNSKTAAPGLNELYASPESFYQPLNPTNDVYSLGAVVYELFTGMPPESGKNRMLKINSRKSDPYIDIRKKHKQISAKMARIINKSLSYSSDNRYQNVIDQKKALQKNFQPFKFSYMMTTMAITIVAFFSYQFMPIMWSSLIKLDNDLVSIQNTITLPILETTGSQVITVPTRTVPTTMPTSKPTETTALIQTSKPTSKPTETTALIQTSKPSTQPTIEPTQLAPPTQTTAPTQKPIPTNTVTLPPPTAAPTPIPQPTNTPVPIFDVGALEGVWAGVTGKETAVDIFVTGGGIDQIHFDFPDNIDGPELRGNCPPEEVTQCLGYESWMTGLSRAIPISSKDGSFARSNQSIRSGNQTRFLTVNGRFNGDGSMTLYLEENNPRPGSECSYFTVFNVTLYKQ